MTDPSKPASDLQEWANQARRGVEALDQVAREHRWPMPERWRTGRRKARNIYLQSGPEPTDEDPQIGCMDTAEYGEQVVSAVNAVTRIEEWIDSDVVTAKSSFGDGYREAMRDISDILRGSDA